MSSAFSDSRAGRQNTYELLHKWEEGDGGAAVEAFFYEFNQRHSNATVQEVSVDNLGLTVKSRILQEDPPEFWMAWPGQNLEPYHEAGVLEDVGAVWEETDMVRQYVDGVREIASIDDEYVSVPTDVHRLNNLFYNVELAETVGVDPGRIDDPRELVEVMRQIEDDFDLISLSQSMKNPRTVVQHWEVLFLGMFGQGSFQAITHGNAAGHRTEIVESLELLSTMAEIAGEDVVFTGFVDAAGTFTADDAVMFSQGDWLAEVFDGAEDFEYEDDWASAPFPGTDGLYHVVMDGAMATNAVDLDTSAREFLEFAGSAYGQTVFNAPKGSIPPRKDVDMTDFPPFLQDQHQAFQRSRAQPPTMAHGLAVSPGQQVELETTMAKLMAEWNVQQTADDLIEVLDE